MIARSAASLVLCYHAVSDRWPASLSVTPHQLRAQLASLLRRGYRARRFGDVVVGPSEPRALAVTFDDAFQSVHRLALPILQELGVPATLFAPTAYVGRGPMTWPGINQWAGGPYQDELTACTWAEIAELVDAGWEIGSHTCGHPHLTTIPDDALERELQESKAVLEQRLGAPCRSLAYPYGDYDERIIAAARRAGYVAAGALPGPVMRCSPLAYPRVYVANRDTRLRFAAKTAPLTARARRARLWVRP